MSVNIGEIYWLEIEFEDTSESKTRPVVVIDLDDDGNAVVTAVVTEITSSPPKDLDSGYGKYRVPIFNWKSSGLTKPSYAKANKTARVPSEALGKKIGQIGQKDVQTVIKYAKMYLQDKEEGLIS